MYEILHKLKARLVRVTPMHVLKPLDCDDTDLNEFFHNDSIPSLKELLTITYVIENDDETIAFYSLLNDKISSKDGTSNRKWDRIRSAKFANINHHFSSYPSLKIARLGVSKKYQSHKIGSLIIDSVKIGLINNPNTQGGCRFITVDAYNNHRTLNFYKKNQFIFLPMKEELASDKTKLMYFDLLGLKNEIERL
jgi:hypothetical protein